MIQIPAKALSAILVSWGAVLGVANASNPLPAVTTQVAAASTAPIITASPTLPLTFTSAQDLVVTLTDLKVPSALASASVVVTQAGALVASAQLTTPASTAMASIPAATGTYTMNVFGVPGMQGVGTFTACVALKADPSNCIQSASTAGSIASRGTPGDPTISRGVNTLTVAAQDSYTVAFSDLKFPVALTAAPTGTLFQGNTQVAAGITSGTAVNLSPGTYQLFTSAQADQTAKAGLYSITVSGSLGSTLVSVTEPVGLANAVNQFNNPTAQSVTLTVADYNFPGPLASASALLTAGGTIGGPAGGTLVGTASAAGGGATLLAPAGTLNLFTYGSAASTAGTYSADVAAGTSDLYTTALGVGPSGSTYAYAFATTNSALVAGTTYYATAADLQFPSQLTGLSFAVAQNGAVLAKSASTATINFTATASTPAVLLVTAQPPATGNGLFDVNIQSSGALGQLIYDKTQSVGSASTLFNSQTLTIGVNAPLDATLSDLMMPMPFDTLALVVSRGSEVLGKISGSSTFSFNGSPGTYQLSLFETLAATQQFGVYSTLIALSPPTLTLTASASSATTGSTITLNWATGNATSCYAAGGSWVENNLTTKTSDSVVLSATTTYTLTCTGQGGTSVKSVTVTATSPPTSHGGGATDPAWLILGSGLLIARLRRHVAASD
jgi:hypothetical protein